MMRRQFEKHCRSCPLRTQGSTAKCGRKLTNSEHEQLLRQARAVARTPEWQAEYRQHRHMVERTIAWLTRGNRKVRYRAPGKESAAVGMLKKIGIGRPFPPS
ncbi:IS1182 family transposase [Mycolicibacterium smegmatis]|uniref:Transposase DDE domain-containing protein n=1 Tax=Mycolicibacterium smegmatis (strain MKD8) TaxID=1214915 RepID=A0A2U9PT85_MYCSE|nr:hypothetical protein D806_040440 [Mycolicibacterium smegmatis MKD8]